MCSKERLIRRCKAKLLNHSINFSKNLASHLDICIEVVNFYSLRYKNEIAIIKFNTLNIFNY